MAPRSAHSSLPLPSTMRHARAPWFVILLAMLALLPTPAIAQTPAASPATSRDPVIVEVDQFGVGESVRPGSWAGIRLRLTNQTDAVRAVAVQLHLRDDDGDTALYTRSIVLNARATEATWLYAPMPWNLAPEREFIVTVHEFDETETTIDAAIGRRLTAARIRPGQQSVTDTTSPMIGVVGQRIFGLNQYDLVDTNRRILPSVHEIPDLRTNLNPALLPDSWLGLAPFETIVWSDTPFRDLGSREDPRVQALIEWVHRGGHLVIAMPPLSGDVYTQANPLLDAESTDPRRNIMPVVRIKRHEDINLEPYRALLTTAAYDDRPLPSRTAIHTFEPIDPDRTLDAIPLLRGPEGTVAVRRIIGAGMVTVIGLDLFNAELAQQGTLRADAFWNRILGKRVDIPPANLQPKFLNRDITRPDGYIALMIARPAAAGVGVILALIVFSIYWILAGPGGFGLLKAFNKTKFAWPAFVLTAAAFTLIGWAGATAIKQTSTAGNHITFFDHIYGSNAQRARMWTSIFLPDYGEQTITIDSPDVAGWNNAITTWSPPGAGASLEFPDARPYIVQPRQFDRRTLPARSTTKDFQIDWLGRSEWRMPAPASAGWEPSLIWPAGSMVQGVRNLPTIRGQLTHQLPGPLTRVSVILVTDQLSETAERDARDRDVRGLILSNAYMAQLPSWTPGDTLDLATVFAGLSPTATPSERDALTLDSATQSRFRQTASAFQSLGITSTEPDRRDGREYTAFTLLSLYSMLPPMPDGQLSNSSDLRQVRRAAHSLDLSAWITQPCLIIIGTIEDADAPINITERTNNSERSVAMKGTTVLRWIYPLEPRPTRFVGVPTNPERAEQKRLGIQNQTQQDQITTPGM